MIKQLLNGEWNLTYREIDDENRQWGKWIKANVPGDIHLDLLNANLISESLVQENNKSTEWTENKVWIYKREFYVSRDLLRKKVEIVFEGIDLTSKIWINQICIGTTDNMFRKYVFDISGIISEGMNTIEVNVDAGFESIKEKPIEKFPEAFHPWDMRSMWMRKSTQTFFWDITPRMITCGIWKDVYLQAYDECRIFDYYVKDEIRGTDACITCEVEIEALEDLEGCQVAVNIQDKLQFVNAISIADIKEGKNKVSVELLLHDAKLWWPNGVGESYLYDMEIYLMTSSGKIYDSVKFRHGVRTIEIEQREINEKEKTFTFIVNGEKVFCKGGDWVPSDTIFARITDEKERELLEYAQNGCQNMMRVWGGGIYPSQNFYNVCDELGIMIWQDFMLACSYYPDFDEDFCNEMRAEIEDVVRAYRNHACLALWSGNNENQQCYDMWEHGDTPLYGLKFYDEIMPEIIGKLDPTTFYWPSSPYGGEHANSSLEGDQHVWDYSMAWLTNGESQLKIWGFADENHKFVSEFGIESPANMDTIRNFFGYEMVEKDKEIWNHHNCWYIFGLIEALQEKYYKDTEITDMREYVLSGQMIQAEAIKDVLEKLKGRMYNCSGTLYWQYNESWAHNGYCIVDYYCKPKQSYYYMKRAFEPINIVFVDNKIVAVNDTLANMTVDVEYGYMSLDGKRKYSSYTTIDLAKTSSVPVVDLADIELKESEDAVVAFAVLWNGERVLARNRKFLSGFKNIQLAPECVSVKCSRINEKKWKLELSSDVFIWDCNIICESMDCRFSDNAFDIWPGETKTVFVETETEMNEFKPEIVSMNYYK